MPAGPVLVNGDGNMETGQTTLNVRGTVLNGTNGFGHEGVGEDFEDTGAADPSAQLRMEIRGASSSAGHTGMNGDQISQDVEMS